VLQLAVSLEISVQGLHAQGHVHLSCCIHLKRGKGREGGRESAREKEGDESGREREREREGREEVCVSEVMQEEMKGCSEDTFQRLTLSGDSLSDLFVFEKSFPAYCLFIF
jgi:hypothetical protein